MQEMTDPERALNRSREYWQKQGRSNKWIQQKEIFIQKPIVKSVGFLVANNVFWW